MRSIFLLSALIATAAHAQTATVIWDWPVAGVSCGTVLPATMCPGYDACTEAASSDALFTGAPAMFGEDIQLCATMYLGSNGALRTWSWPTTPDLTHMLLYEVNAAADFVVDSITMRSRSDDNQLATLHVGVDQPWPSIWLADLNGPPAWNVTVSPLGLLVPAGSYFRVMIQAEPGALPTDGWWHDYLRVNAHADTGTGLQQITPADPTMVDHAWYDVMGRPVDTRAAAGVYVQGRKRVVVLEH